MKLILKAFKIYFLCEILFIKYTILFILIVFL